MPGELSNGSIHLTTMKFHSFLSDSRSQGWVRECFVFGTAICSAIRTSVNEIIHSSDSTSCCFDAFARYALASIRWLEKSRILSASESFPSRHVEVNSGERVKMWKLWNFFSASQSKCYKVEINFFSFRFGCLFLKAISHGIPIFTVINAYWNALHRQKPSKQVLNTSTWAEGFFTWLEKIASHILFSSLVQDICWWNI